MECSRSATGWSGSDCLGFERNAAGIGGSLVEMPERPTVLIGFSARCEVCIDVLECGLDPIQQIPEVFERLSRQQDFVLAEAVLLSELARLVGTLAMRLPAVLLRASRAPTGFESSPTPLAAAGLTEGGFCHSDGNVPPCLVHEPDFMATYLPAISSVGNGRFGTRGPDGMDDRWEL
jgi:hypothetical protein